MPDWQVTAKTIYCDAVDDEVTVMIYGDWTAACTGYSKYCHPDGSAARLLEQKSRGAGRKLRCEGLDCYRIRGYIAKLEAEEAPAAREEQ